MALVSTRSMLKKAQQGGYAVGAFNVENMEMVQAVIAAAQEMNAPVMIQTTPGTVRYAGLDLYYCVEPIGPEHTYEELADEMLRAREYKVNMMAVMGRVGVPGTRFADSGEITELELTKIAAVAGLVTAPGKSMNVHEPKKMPLLAGVNQLYAEIGINPRDTSEKTEDNRGKGIRETVKLLEEAEYRVEKRK